MNEQELVKRVEQVTDESKEVLAYLQTYEIATPEQFQQAAAQYAEWKEAHAKLEASRKELTEPLNKTVKKINDRVRPALTFFDTALKLLKGIMGSYQFKEEQRQRKALEEAAELAEEGDIAGATLAIARVESQQPKIEGLSSRDDWDFEVIDASKLPRHLLVPDLVAIRAEVKAKKREDAIPGVRAFVKKVFTQKKAV